MHFPEVTQPFLAIKLRQVAACKKERKREREREKERERERKRPGKGEGSRPGQREEERKKKEQDMSRHALLPRPTVVLATKARKQGREPEPAPRGERGKKKEEEERRRTTEPETAAPESRERRKNKNSRTQISKIIQKRTPRTRQKRRPIQITEFVAQNLPQKRAVTKIELRKNLRKGELRFSPLSGRKKGHFWAQKSSQQNPGLPFRSSFRKNLRKKPKTCRTLKKPQNEEDSLQKNSQKKTDSTSP